MSQITMAGRPGGAVSPAVWVALGLGLVGAFALALGQSPRIAALFVVGGAFGLVLYHAAFGFTSAWRNFIRDGRGRGLRAQMVMLAIAVALFFPALAAGSLFGQEVSGFVSPVGVSVLVGAFMFGIGMQLGGGCASGTLYTAGGGNARMLITLAFFIVGSLLATIHFDWWMALPAFEPVSIVETFGAPLGIVLSLALFAVIAAVTILVEKRRHGGLEQAEPTKREGLARFARGPWPLVAGAIALALLNFATLALAGRPWGITSAFALWGAKLSQFVGVEPSAWFYWQQPANATALASNIFSDITSVMNFGIILGALLASALAGRFAPNFAIPKRSVLAAVVGGLLLGYGARIAFGCNIGAYFGGIASGSLHGWLWLVAAFAGSTLGVRLRPFFFADERPHVTKDA
ncbi:YeeE/YedE family protein [Aurantimonas sp. HBX-1]|uniref:YeeE/YedE family protein n=1 Tax=Aurantimonas sp. HBX-1 TaxID=2906072 RepID=UPI001F461F57|nr:YeeE/YedE family protein [Aurantimonas sp. HBX-1]UIJ71909.1 YeeE/YedE family protein [Aurantimonas sp. HBX-1]